MSHVFYIIPSCFLWVKRRVFVLTFSPYNFLAPSCTGLLLVYEPFVRNNKIGSFVYYVRLFVLCHFYWQSFRVVGAVCLQVWFLSLKHEVKSQGLFRTKMSVADFWEVFLSVRCYAQWCTSGVARMFVCVHRLRACSTWEFKGGVCNLIDYSLLLTRCRENSQRSGADVRWGGP